MIHRLTEDQTQTRLKNQTIREKKKGIAMKDKSKRLMSINVLYDCADGLFFCVYTRVISWRSSVEYTSLGFSCILRKTWLSSCWSSSSNHSCRCHYSFSHLAPTDFIASIFVGSLRTISNGIPSSPSL